MDFRRIGATFGSFRHNRSGNVATILGLSMVPLILLVGASVDYTRSVTKRTSLQQATDAAALSAAQSLSKNPSTATLNTATTNFFTAAVNDSNAWIDSGPTVSPDNTQVCLTTRTKVPTMIMGAASGMGMKGSTQVTVVASSCAKINNLTYEVAMVLDNSGSMSESSSGTTKIASLISAANQMVATLDPAGQTPKASFSLVPFSLAVNVGSKYRGASWIDNNGQSSIAGQNYRIPSGLPVGAFLPTNRFALLDAMGQSWGGCLEERPGSYLASDDPATSSVGDSLFEPFLYPDEYSTTKNQQNMASSGMTAVNNYLTKQSNGGTCQPNDLYYQADQPNSKTPLLLDDGNPTLPRGDTQTEICKYNGKNNVRALSYYGAFTTGPNMMCDSQPLTTLTNNTSTLTSQINAMTAKGNTNLFSGFMWGWRTISPNGPFNTQSTSGAIGPQNAQAYSAVKNVKVIILMTDGFNNWTPTAGYGTSSPYGNNASSYSPFGYYENNRLAAYASGGTTNSSNWRSVMDTATLAACTNAKNAGIQIFTVGFSVPSDPIDAAGTTLLQNCATLPSMYYPASDGNGLIAAFNSIAQAMSGLRLVN